MINQTITGAVVSVISDSTFSWLGLLALIWSGYQQKRIADLTKKSK